MLPRNIKETNKLSKSLHDLYFELIFINYLISLEGLSFLSLSFCFFQFCTLLTMCYYILKDGDSFYDPKPFPVSFCSDLSNNNLSGSIPQGVANLAKLETWWLPICLFLYIEIISLFFSLHRELVLTFRHRPIDSCSCWAAWAFLKINLSPTGCLISSLIGLQLYFPQHDVLQMRIWYNQVQQLIYCRSCLFPHFVFQV